MARRMRFGTWCKKDLEDETKIVYTFRMKENDGEVHTAYFTSEDEQSFSMISRLHNAWIEKIEYIDNEFSTHWNAVLYED